MQIAAGICTYASPHLLKRCLESLRELTDLNIVIHGRFKGFPQVLEYKESYLLSMLIIEHYDNVEFVDMGDMRRRGIEEEKEACKTQMEHRNEYLKVCKREGIDWLLVVDDDDYVVRKRTASPQKLRNDLEILRKEIDSKPQGERFFLYNVACIQEEDEQLPTPYIWQRPRMLYQPCYFEYLESAHYHLRDPMGRIYKGHPGHSLIPELFLRHDQDANDKQRLANYMQAKREYEAWQRINESG